MKSSLIKKVDHYHIYIDIVLGQGQFGKVNMAVDELSKNTQNIKYYAVKVLFKL